MNAVRTWIVGMGAGELPRCVYVIKEENGYYAQTYDYHEGGGVGRMHDRCGPFETSEEASSGGRAAILATLEERGVP